MPNKAGISTSPTVRDPQVLALLEAIVTREQEPPALVPTIQSVARSSRRSFDRVFQALLRLDGTAVHIGYLPTGVLAVAPATHPEVHRMVPAKHSLRRRQIIGPFEQALKEQVARAGRGVESMAVRDALLQQNIFCTSQLATVCCHALLKRGKITRAFVATRNPDQRRPRWVWGPIGIDLKPERVIISQGALAHQLVDELARELGRPVSRAEIRAWAKVGLPGASAALLEYRSAVSRLMQAYLPVVLGQTKGLNAWRPSGAARGTLGSRYSTGGSSMLHHDLIGLEDAIERFAFGKDLDLERDLRSRAGSIGSALQHVLVARDEYRRAALRSMVRSEADIEALAAHAVTAASKIMSWITTPRLRKTCERVVLRCERVLAVAPLLVKIAAQDAPTSIKRVFVADRGLRDWTDLERWRAELVERVPRRRRSASILSGARRFPGLGRVLEISTAETSIDVLDGLEGLLETMPLPRAKTLVDTTCMLFGTIMRDATVVIPLLGDPQVPRGIRYGALIGASLLGAPLRIDPRSFGHQRQDIDALAFAAAVEPEASADTIEAVLTPIAAEPLPMRGRALKLIERAHEGARLTLIDD